MHNTESHGIPPPALISATLSPLFPLSPQQTLSPGAELVAAALAVVYMVVAFFGASANHRLAVAWAKAFAGPDGFFARQFAACGAGAAEAGREGVAVPLVKESASCYKFYASGRRFCEGEA